MIIEIRGTGFANVGAELMLASIVERIGGAIPGVQFVVEPHIGPFVRRAKYGLLQVFDVRTAGRMGPIIERLFHRGYRGRYGLVTRSEIDITLDASGFALGDAWETEVGKGGC